MIKRILTLLAAVALLVVAGCAAGKDGAEAEELLRQATEAQDQIESLTFSMNMVAEAEGQSFTMLLSGGGYVKGEQKGDMFVQASLTAPELPPMRFQMVMRDGRIYQNLDGTWQELPGGASQAETAALEQQLADFDFAKYVKEVSVEKGTTFLGEPVTKIVGKIDTQGLIAGVFDQLGSAATSLSGGFAPPEDVLDGLGDVRAVLYISDTTHLVKAARIEFELEYQGQTGTIEVNYALRSVNEPVEIPEPAIVA